MWRFDMFYEDWTLLLTPRFAVLGDVWQIVVLTALALLPLGLLGWLYRYEVQLVGLKALALLSTRLLVMTSLWGIVSFQPMLVRTHTEEMPGRVQIAVDRSGSMGVADPQRSNLEKLRLARVLKMRLPTPADTAALLERWLKHYEEKGEDAPPQWNAFAQGLPDTTENRNQLAQQQKWHDELCAEIDRLTRSEVCRRVLAADGLGIVAKLRQKHKVELFGFHQQAWEASPDALAALFGPLSPNDSTDVGLPLLRALERSGPEQGKVLGVILLSDGRHNAGEAPLRKATELGDHKIPLYPVIIGSKRPTVDIAIVEMTAPSNVFKDVSISVEGRIKISGLPAQDVTVELHHDGKPPDKERTQVLKHNGSDRTYHVRFPLRMEKVGPQQVTLKVKPSQSRSTEITLDNNQQSAVVRVAKDKVRVLVLDGEMRWESHYLLAALKRDKAIEPDAVIFVQPRLGQVPEEQLEKAGNPRLQIPPIDKDKGDPLSKYDCVILGDVTPAQLPLEQRARLARYVSDRGGTLVILAGKRAMPLSFQAAGDPLVKLLPIEQPYVVRPLAGFDIKPTGEGTSAPVLQLETTPEQSAARWQELPRHFWGVAGKLKPGAQALLTYRDAGKDSKDALLAQQNYGFGKVVYVGLDSTWRWRFRTGDLYHHRFWGQLLRWAASDKLLPAGNKYVRYGTREAVYGPGREVEVVVRLEDDTLHLPAGSAASVRIVRVDGGKDAAVVKLNVDKAQSRVLVGQVRDLPPGQYRLELDIPALADKIKHPPEEKEADAARRDAFTVLPSESSEMQQLSTDWSMLQALAAQSHGEACTVDGLERLLERFAQQVIRREHREEQRFWQDLPQAWYLLGLVLTLLTVEWVGRKLVGLP